MPFIFHTKRVTLKKKTKVKGLATHFKTLSTFILRTCVLVTSLTELYVVVITMMCAVFNKHCNRTDEQYLNAPTVTTVEQLFVYSCFH